VIKKAGTKFVHEGDYAADIEVEWIESERGWSPYIAVEDVQKLDEVKGALRRGDIKAAGRLARVYQLTPVSL
jgi:hypothetical protein